MRKIGWLVLVIIFSSLSQVKAQEEQTSLKPYNDAWGVGIGQDFGGYGLNIQKNLSNYVYVFGGLGYALTGLGYNVGLKINQFNKPVSINPYLIAMYGYTTVVQIKNYSSKDKLFYGPSIGVGLDVYSGKLKKGFWSVGINFPLRSSAVDNYIDDLKDDGITFQNELFPFTLSVGYHLIFK